jgi:hypothetical protein
MAPFGSSFKHHFGGSNSRMMFAWTVSAEWIASTFPYQFPIGGAWSRPPGLAPLQWPMLASVAVPGSAVSACAPISQTFDRIVLAADDSRWCYGKNWGDKTASKLIITCFNE